MMFTKGKTVRVYRLTEDDYVAAHSLEDAIRFYFGDTGVDVADYWKDGGGPSEVSAVDMHKLWIRDEETGYSNTFSEHLKSMLSPDQQVPFHFASIE